MATLTGNKIKDSYLGLLKSIDNAPFSPRAAGTFVQISDGGGNSLPLYLAVNAIRFYDAYTFPSADGTVNGQVLSTDANGTLSWVTSSDNQTLEEVLTQGNTTTIAISSSADITTTAQFNGDINGALLQKVKAAEALSKGDVVYISGGTGDNPEVSKAKADSITTMPSLGIMKENLSLNSEGECITSGELTGLATLLGSFSTGDDLYVSSSTAGALQNTAPTGEANLIQKIGKVIKGGNGGALTVLGAFRTNAVPNLDSAKIFLGNASNEAVSTAISGDATISDTGVIALATVPVTKGGTGATTLTGILLGNATSAISGITSAVDGHVLTADGNGGYDFEVASGDVSISGTPTTNQVAIWTDGSTIKGMSALEIDVNDKITLDQDASSYNIGGGNIANVTGTNNTGFGLENLNVVTSGDGNVAIGYRALKSLTIGGSNTAIGYNSLEFLSNLVDGHNGNTAVGLSSGRRNNGGFNTFIGFQSGQGSINTSNNNSFNNTALGYFSLNKLTSGNSNTGVGSSALEDNTTGVLNTCLGQGSGREITTGSKNVILGSFTGFSGGTDIRTSDNNIIISDGSGNNRIQVNSGGDVGIGITPSTIWSTSYNALQIGLGGSIYAHKSAGSSMRMAANVVYEGTAPSYYDKYLTTSTASKYEQDSGNHVWSTAASGTINTAIPWSERMRIDGTTGNVGIGTTTLDANANLTVFGNYRTDFIRDYYGGNRAYILRFGANTASSGHVIGSQIVASLASDDVNGSLEFYTKNAGNLENQLTISSGGNVGIGDTSTISELLYVSSISGDSRIGLNAPTNSDAEIKFSENNVVKYSIGHDAFTGNFVIGTANVDTPKLIISSVGNVTIGNSAAQDFYLALRGGVGGFFGWDDSANKTIVQAPNTRSLSFQVNSDTFGSGTEALTISSAAKVGIGVSPDTNSKLTIKGSGDSTTSNSIAVYNSTNASIFTVIDNGAVSIGGSFSIVPSSASSTVRIQPDVDNNAYLGLINRRYIAVYAVNGSIQTSDIREKTEIKTIKLGLDFINDLNPISYKWKDCKRLQGYENIKDERNHQGLIAQEFAETLEKHGINKNEFGGLDIQKTEKYDDFHGMTYSQLIAPMIKAIQEQQTIIEDLKSRIETLEG